MLRFIDNYLDRITMYRLMLYFLIVLISAAALLSFFGAVQYSPVSILGSTLFLITVCFITSKVFSLLLKAPTNFESSYITALILTLIMHPAVSFDFLPILALVGVLAISSKYILAIHKKHIFNPVAIAVVLLASATGTYADWWGGEIQLLPLVILGGLLIMRKTRREHMLFCFFAIAMLTAVAIGLFNGANMEQTVTTLLFHSALCFLGFIMFIEPLTTPPSKKLQLFYASLVGVLFSSSAHIGDIYLTPEIALVIGNIFSYLVSPKQKLFLHLAQKIQVAPDIADFVFRQSKKMTFLPGQYMEWTLMHNPPDSRGERRYFTLASSPTEDTLRLGVKFYQNGSSFKKALADISAQTPIVASQLSGEFVLPQQKDRKLVFVAGGIGVTPYRSIVKYLLDNKELRPIVILYANKVADDIVYKDIFDQAERELAIKTVYSLTDRDHVPTDWKGRVGRIDAAMIAEEIPDWKERYFYLSGPHTMVTGYEDVLSKMGVPKKQMKTDFFPGYA